MRSSRRSKQWNLSCRRLAALAVALGAVAVAPRTVRALPLAADHGCIGRWVGEGRNTGSATSWTIDLTLSAAPSGGRCGTIEYTNPACGGTLESCNVVDGDIHTRELYTHNDGHCAPAGRVIIRCEGDRMRYSWIGWERVDSVLHRPGGTPQTPRPGVTPPTPGVTPPTPTVPRPAVPGPTPAPGPGPAPVTPRPRNGPPAQPPRGIGGCAAAGDGAGIAWAGAVALAWVAACSRRRRRARRG